MRARLFILAQDKKHESDHTVQLAASEFRGMVYGYMDGALSGDVWDEKIDRCARDNDLEAVVRDTAAMLISGPLRRDVPSRFQLGLSVLLTCDALRKK